MPQLARISAEDTLIYTEVSTKQSQQRSVLETPFLVLWAQILISLLLQKPSINLTMHAYSYRQRKHNIIN